MQDISSNKVEKYVINLILMDILLKRVMLEWGITRGEHKVHLEKDLTKVLGRVWIGSTICAIKK